MLAPETPSTDVRVLIVDDTTCCRQTVCELLERRGYEVAGEAAGVDAALRMAESIQPDAALLDVHLPDGNGFELAERLTRSHPGMAVLLTSADFDEHFYARADASGARGFVPKSQLAQVKLERFWPGNGRR
ncbi:MAG TPA: response regulator [Solirubrobacteraceae bacterium]|nr:response regulator [Solirubrobacteraceae bacterium]